MKVKAEAILGWREILDPDDVLEVRIWKVPKSERYPDGVKFRPFYVGKGVVKVGYDNHHPKGPHRHFLGQEEPYTYKAIQSLVDDFLKDVENVRRRS